MIFSDKLQILRKSQGYTQNEVSDKLGVSRQAVAKWETGQFYPDITNLIALSKLFNVTIDYLVKDQDCSVSLSEKQDTDIENIISFRLEASKNTYAASTNQTESTRLDSKDYRYEKGDYVYHDSFVGKSQFTGEEVIFYHKEAIYSMNYMGRVVGQNFSGDFLKEALKKATHDSPFRGPALYQKGQYTYTSKVNGSIDWFLGFEEIHCDHEKVYECYFHGGMLK